MTNAVSVSYVYGNRRHSFQRLNVAKDIAGMKVSFWLRVGLFIICLVGCQVNGSDEVHSSLSPTNDATLTDSAPLNDPIRSVEMDEADSMTVQLRIPVTHKMMKNTGENRFASLAYECPECTFEQWESIVPPEGWSKGPAQISLFSPEESTMRSYPSVDGHPESVDFLSEVPGNEYRVIAVNLDGQIVQRSLQGAVVEVQVQRDTRLVFTIGMRIHELTSPDGATYVLFAHHIDDGEWQDVDYQTEDVLDYFTPPMGWTYSTRILQSPVVLDANDSQGVVTVLAIRGAINSTWEKRQHPR